MDLAVLAFLYMKIKLPSILYFVLLVSLSLIFVSAGSLALAKDDSESNSDSGRSDSPMNKLSDDAQNRDRNNDTTDSNSSSDTNGSDIQNLRDRQERLLRLQNRREGRGNEKEPEDRLAGVRLKVCEEKRDNIKNRSEHLDELSSNMLRKFDSILSRVKDFYTNKVLPSGKSISNYEALLADIQAKKDAVQIALEQAKSDISGFSCDSANPKSQLTTYREDMQAVKRALKEYRTSIKNLIIAIHGVVGTENEDNKTPESSEPTGSKGVND